MQKDQKEMRNNQRRVALTFGVGAGGLLAAAFMPMAVAFADNYDFTPDITSFAPTQVEGFPPLINEVTGAETWGVSDLTTNTVEFHDVILGTDTATTIGSFTNDDYLTSTELDVIGTSATLELPAGSQIDLANFGFGYENEWMDIPSGPDTGMSDLLITPFGDFALFGTGFSDLAAAFG
ncbi:MAG TPA: hypothetical protein VN741_11475 [Mycobacterium sp.]|nr:hypothetical protein [Mycobacterium sp.]